MGYKSCLTFIECFCHNMVRYEMRMQMRMPPIRGSRDRHKGVASVVDAQGEGIRVCVEMRCY